MCVYRIMGLRVAILRNELTQSIDEGQGVSNMVGEWARRLSY